MSELKHPRVRTAELYHRGYRTTAEEFIRRCEDERFDTAIEHIEFHRPELFALLGVPINDTVRRSLAAKEYRPPYGLIRNGAMAVRTLPPDLNGAIARSLYSDRDQVIDDDRNFYDEFEPILAHMHSIDSTNYTEITKLLAAGIHTMLDRFKDTHDSLTVARPNNSSDWLKAQWKILLPQARVSLREIVQMTHNDHPQDHPIVVTDDDSPRFCREAITRVTDVAKIPNSKPIGCPITLEPDLLRGLWMWYVDLRGAHAQSTALPAEPNADIFSSTTS